MELLQMGKVRARKETGNLYLDFTYEGLRCREQTSLKDTISNRKKVEALLNKVEAMILLNNFDYEAVFPKSKNIQKVINLNESKKVKSEHSIGETSGLPSFNKYAQNWFNLKKIEWRESHCINTKSIIDKSLNPRFGLLPVNKISKQEILSFRSELSTKKGRNSSGHLSNKTINNHLQVLRNILLDAAEEYDFVSTFRNIKPLKRQKVHINPFSLDEVNLIVNNVRKDYKNYYVLRFYTGLRTGEIDGLKWKYVDFENKLILIRETIVNGKTEYTKTDGSQRELPMLGPVFDVLKEQYISTGKTSKYVFCNKNKHPLDHNNVTKRVWYPLLSSLNLEKRRPYQSRHTAATILLASGENPEWIARFLGHNSTEMLFSVYSRFIPNLTRQDGSAFEKLLTKQNMEIK
jgi:integrase